MSRTVVWLVVGGAVVIAGALGVAWSGRQSEKAGLDQAGKPAAAATVQAAAPKPPVATPSPSATPAPISAPAVTGAAPAPSPPSPATALPPLAAPSFDIARIGPDGRAVVAGRASPGAKIVLLNGGKEIAHGEADGRGEWVVIIQDPPLKPGQHELRVVQHIEGRAPVTSDQVVVAVVPDAPVAASSAATAAGAPAAAGSAPPVGTGPREQTLVMISPPTGTATLVQPPSPAGVPKSADLALSTLDYDEHGQVTVTGQASPRAVVRVYINDKLVAEGAAGADGHWKLAPTEPVGPGKHTLRLDRLAGDGKPAARLELPFDRVMVSPSTKEGRRLVVVRGDNLWNIARAHYGVGYHHTVIYGANKDQIRDPDLIYPGQVFSLPKVN